ncbi:cytochrome P450 [Lysobacter sp. K5869]|uniref:cytochrome P450 n=1 Tax=Lysobacter sp. K5869 TaxID=2820808 RepID=UPI001C05F7DA|nr:cytochrome P450 [Lysobacter sp. K5869]QWP77577.1 cytochrome P450 [Lysobacter sp. K5869]
MTADSCPHLRASFPFPGRGGSALPDDYLQRLRERALVPATLANGRAAWLVTRYADVRTVMSDPRFSRQAWAGGTLFARDSKALALVTSDPPQHTRRRAAVQAAFAPHRAQHDRARIAALAEECLDAFEAQGSPGDLVAGFTKPFPYAVICELVGVPRADVDRLHPTVDTMMSAGRFPADAVAAAHREMHGYFAALLDAKQARLDAGHAPADLLDRLLAEHGDDADPETRLSREEIAVLGFGLFMAGGETTMNHLALCVYEVVRDRELADALRRDPDKIPAAVEELLRWIWFGATGMQPHVALEDVALEGGTIRAGEVVVPLTEAANRDPAVFDQPDRFLPERAHNRHMGFGVGRHVCLGAPHARVELQVGLEALLRRFPRLELAVPETELAWRTNMFLRGVWRLPTRFSR